MYAAYYSQLGFVLWPERGGFELLDEQDYSQLGFVLWPEPLADFKKLGIL